MTVYGYARVSTKDQNLARQIKALNDAGCEQIFREKVTGTKRERPQLEALLETVKEGDVVIVKDLTRISRSTKDLIELVELFGKKGVGFKSLNESWLDTSKNDAVSKLMFTIFAGLVEFERNQLSERTLEGLAVAKANNKRIGRPSKDKANIEHAISLWENGRHNIKDICKITGVGKSTLYRKLKERGLK
ncbi:recombinase family protein [Bacillus haynesii]|uniref:recombinase family protein n=1 Tax=Bacillus haynesii TaxID=1925021 RepID=UPI00227E89CD|nr:recombinase family protein [Bacillus haynesii]MCY9324059.1 recombinase family protein [Bacillus haynesii]